MEHLSRWVAAPFSVVVEGRRRLPLSHMGEDVMSLLMMVVAVGGSLSRLFQGYLAGPDMKYPDAVICVAWQSSCVGPKERVPGRRCGVPALAWGWLQD